MTIFSPAAPTEDSTGGLFARRLLGAIGTAIRAVDGGVTAAVFLALGDSIGARYTRATQALSEAFVDTALDLLSEHEEQYGLPVRTDLTPEQRRARLVAKVRAARSGTPKSILSAVRAVCPEPVFLYEYYTMFANADGDPRLVYEWVLSIAAGWADAVVRESVLSIVQQMKPAHTRGNVATNADSPFLADDPNSLTDRDVLNG